MCTTPHLVSGTVKRKGHGWDSPRYWPLVLWTFLLIVCLLIKHQHNQCLVLDTGLTAWSYLLNKALRAYDVFNLDLCEQQKCHSLNCLTKACFMWWFALQGCLLYRDMNSHSMAAIKINPETLEQEGTITMPGTNTPLMWYWSLRAGQINGLTSTLFFPVLTGFLLKQGLSFFSLMANSFLYNYSICLYIALDILCGYFVVYLIKYIF